ncbi:unnamed protein product [Protopolystoma xenopodis]|uniref:Uncharacterized protein n=1 Tax=Protopolystoma xenopodis TaxID=117903 RepID=A0A3S5A3R1_9PLAT|nr:unnamed protein product [Protopolystoma xenopodis]
MSFVNSFDPNEPTGFELGLELGLNCVRGPCGDVLSSPALAACLKDMVSALDSPLGRPSGIYPTSSRRSK